MTPEALGPHLFTHCFPEASAKVTVVFFTSIALSNMLVLLLCKFSLGEDFPQWKAALSPCCPPNPPHSLPIFHILLIFNTVILEF